MLPPVYTSLPDTFWSKVDEPDSNGCWNWNAATDQKGYGKISIGGRQLRANRASLEDETGISDHQVLQALHRCDNPPCVNPDHLYWGTPQNNTDDMIRRGRERRPKGPENGRSKLTKGDVMEARHLYATGSYSYVSLAKRFGVVPITISNAIHRRTWNHV